jgi:glycerol-3-phosphate acyltransferase PlsY
MLNCLICLLVGYLCGSVLTAEIVARRMTGRSVFELGDGNPGMANVGHELGTKAALVCLAGDILKTLLPVLVMSRLFPQLGWAVVTGWTGLGATLGHILPFWHGFRGGKGVTTIASTIILMNPLWGILAGVVGVGTIIVSGYLSVAAVVAMLFYTIATAFTLPFDCALISLFFTALQVLTHWSKLQGISTGTTHRASLSTKFWAKFGR